jgi:hypothetical protein
MNSSRSSKLAAEVTRRHAALRELYSELAHDHMDFSGRRELWALVDAEQAALAKLKPDVPRRH